MADNRKSPARTVQRCYECHRLEEALWKLAYEQLWLVLRRRLHQQTAEQQQPGVERTSTITDLARRA